MVIQAIKSTWTFVNRWLHDNADHDNLIFDTLLKLLRAVTSMMSPTKTS